MKPETGELLQGIIRHVKGALNLFAKWIAQRSGVAPKTQD